MHLFRTCPVAFAIITIMAPLPAYAVEFTTSSKLWCKDSATVCWWPNASALNGVRVVADLAIGTIVQREQNRIERSLLQGAPRFGAELNLLEGWIAAQFVFIPPFGTKLDPTSSLVVDMRLNNLNREISVDFGYAIGLSLAEGLISIGFGRLEYDPRGIANATAQEASGSFFYVNFNPVATLRAATTRLKPE